MTMNILETLVWLYII